MFQEVIQKTGPEDRKKRRKKRRSTDSPGSQPRGTDDPPTASPTSSDSSGRTPPDGIPRASSSKNCAPDPTKKKPTKSKKPAPPRSLSQSKGPLPPAQLSDSEDENGVPRKFDMPEVEPSVFGDSPKTPALLVAALEEARKQGHVITETTTLVGPKSDPKLLVCIQQQLRVLSSNPDAFEKRDDLEFDKCPICSVAYKFRVRKEKGVEVRELRDVNNHLKRHGCEEADIRALSCWGKRKKSEGVETEEGEGKKKGTRGAAEKYLPCGSCSGWFYGNMDLHLKRRHHVKDPKHRAKLVARYEQIKEEEVLSSEVSDLEANGVVGPLVELQESYLKNRINLAETTVNTKLTKAKVAKIGCLLLTTYYEAMGSDIIDVTPVWEDFQRLNEAFSDVGSRNCPFTVKMYLETRFVGHTFRPLAPATYQYYFDEAINFFDYCAKNIDMKFPVTMDSSRKQTLVLIKHNLNELIFAFRQRAKYWAGERERKHKRQQAEDFIKGVERAPTKEEITAILTSQEQTAFRNMMLQIAQARGLPSELKWPFMKSSKEESAISTLTLINAGLAIELMIHTPLRQQVRLVFYQQPFVDEIP
jgi:hypothetical protein